MIQINFGVMFNFGEALPFQHKCIMVYLQKQDATQVACLLYWYIAIAMATSSSDHSCGFCVHTIYVH